MAALLSTSCTADSTIRTRNLVRGTFFAFVSTVVWGQDTDGNSNVCDLTDRGSSFDIDVPAWKDCDFLMFHPSFASLLPEQPGVTLLEESDQAIFHEGPVLWQDKLFFNSNRLGDTSLGPSWGEAAPAQLDQYIDMYEYDLLTGDLTTVKPQPQEILMGNGMTLSGDGQKILALSQGFNTTGAAMYEMNPSTYETKLVLNNYYGTPFNSFNDIQVTADDEIIFFTDPVYGFEQGFRAGNPQLGSNVYRFDRTTQTVNLISTDYQRPNGIALYDERSNGGGCTLFLTDSGFEPAHQKPRGFEGEGDTAIYTIRDPAGCFDPADGPWASQPLAPAAKGIHDGIHVHGSTKLLLYCDGNGAWIWSIPTYQALGMIKTPCTQLVFPKEDGVQPVYILSEQRLYSTELNFVSDGLPVPEAVPEVRTASSASFQTLTGSILVWLLHCVLI